MKNLFYGASFAPLNPQHQGGLVLLFVVMVWGTTFPAMKLLSPYLDALQIIGARFAIALLLLAPLWRGLRKAEWRWGLLLGTLLFLAFWLQIEGLARTTSNRNAFVTGLNVLMVPLLAMTLLGRRYSGMLWLACGMALAGMLLMFHDNGQWNTGDTLTLASTLFYAIYTLALEESAQRHAKAPLRPTRMAAVQSLVMLVAAMLWIVVRHGGLASSWLALNAMPTAAWLSLLYLGMIASVVVVVLQAWGQQRVDAMRSAIVFGLEPVFAAVTAWWMLGERLGTMELQGAALMVAALVASQIPMPQRRLRAQSL